MFRQIVVPASAALLLFAFGVAAAQTVAPTAPPTAPRAPKTLKVVTSEQLDPGRLLPPPPADGTDQQKAELAEIQRLYKTRTPERRAIAEWDDKHESAELFFKTLGPGFDLAKLPATAKMLAVMDNEQSVAANIAKRFFLRNRPWAIDPSLVACDYKPNAAPRTSYPSGHAMLSYSLGFVLADVMPEKAQAIQTRAEEYAYNREICAAHYPTDIEASHVLAVELALMMLRNPTFAAEVEASRAELRAAGLTK